MHLYAFGKVPGWVSLSTESRTASKAASKDTAAAAAANPKPAARPSMAQSQKRSSTPSGVGVSDEQAAVRGDIGSDLNGSPSANGKEVTQVASGLHPRVNGMQQQSVGPAEESTDRSTLVQRSNQSKDNARLPGVFQHCTVPMPMPNGSYQHLSHPTPVPHMYLPYASPDIQQHVPGLYPSIVPQYPVVQTTTTTDGQANMDAVMRKFDEMQEMFRQMQAERWQGQA
ncbi:hypothetical protein EV175_003105 [Coemansia sp. RSA 1933]|nr:hypothetical protein EV175_003105 [Coemansia sp. RSA 1933]